MQKLEQWLRDILTDGIKANLSGLFDQVNTKVAEIAVTVGKTPQSWNPSIYNMIKNISDNVDENGFVTSNGVGNCTITCTNNETGESDECEIHVELLWWKMIENIFYFLKSLLKSQAKLYKYPYADQLMIYAQRPDASLCLTFDDWTQTMNRYIHKGAKGIGLHFIRKTDIYLSGLTEIFLLRTIFPESFHHCLKRTIYLI